MLRSIWNFIHGHEPNQLPPLKCPWKALAQRLHTYEVTHIHNACTAAPSLGGKQNVNGKRCPRAQHWPFIAFPWGNGGAVAVRFSMSLRCAWQCECLLRAVGEKGESVNLLSQPQENWNTNQNIQSVICCALNRLLCWHWAYLNCLASAIAHSHKHINLRLRVNIGNNSEFEAEPID